jgi:integrase
MNVWSALTSAFNAATSSKRRPLRVLDGQTSPCANVEPPGDRESRKARRRSFIFPSEFQKLAACESVPIEWRELHAIAAYTYLRPNELRVLRWADVDLEHGIINVSKAWDSREDKLKAPKTRNGVRPVPIPSTLAPLLRRMRSEDVPADALVVPLLANTPEDTVAKHTRRHLRLAGIARPELFADTPTTVQANFRTWRDSGITWLALEGVGVDKIMRRAGHDHVGTTLGYVKLAEAIGGNLGTPFPPLPAALIKGHWSTEWSTNGGTKAQRPDNSGLIQCEGRDLNPHGVTR